MSYNVTGVIATKPTKLSDNTATTVLGTSKRTTVLSIVCTEWGNGTPTVTIDLYDGTTTYYLRNALAMTAKQTITFDTEFVLAQNQVLRVTSSDASGEVDVLVNYLNPDATAQGQR